MAETTNKKIETESAGSWAGIISQFGDLSQAYMSQLGKSNIFRAFSGAAVANMPSIQNRRVKAISPLPADYSKEQIGDFLRNPYNSEIPLGQVAETLKYTSYPWYKIIKSYSDIPTYRYYFKPLYPKYDARMITKEDVKSTDFLRETMLLDKMAKRLNIPATCHKIVGQAMLNGKVFYHPRCEINRTHNEVNSFFLQQLPQLYTKIIGFNNVSGYTVSFNMMYFMQPGCVPEQFGDLFAPYWDDFMRAFDVADDIAPKRTTRFYSRRNGKNLVFNVNKVDPRAPGNPRAFMQNGRWMYYVTLPVEKAWTFEIDDTTAAVVSPLGGLMLTYAQQSDYEAAQLALLVSPLVKIFTGEIPYFNEKVSTKEDGIRLSAGGRETFATLFDLLMEANNTGGTALYMAPLQNIKSHDFPESANANNISTSFSRYALEKAGLSGIIPATDDPKAGLAELSAKLESQYVNCVYRGFERMMNYIISDLNLKYAWEFTLFGTIYNEENLRQKAEKALANGDTSAHYILAALDGQSFTEKLSMTLAVNESGLLDRLIPPITSYTMKQEYSGLPPRADEGGRPAASDTDIADGVGEASDNDHTADYKGG